MKHLYIAGISSDIADLLSFVQVLVAVALLNYSGFLLPLKHRLKIELLSQSSSLLIPCNGAPSQPQL